MATSIHVKTTGKWKPVEINNALLSQGDLDYFISLEELTDYQLIKDSPSKSDRNERKKKETKDSKQKDKGEKERKILIPPGEKSIEEEGGKTKKKKRKKKKKTKQDGDKVDSDKKSVLDTDSESKKKTKPKMDTEGKNKNVQNLNSGSKKKKSGKLVQTGTSIVDVNKEIESVNDGMNSGTKKLSKRDKKKGKKRKPTDTETIPGSPNKKQKLESPTELVKTDMAVVMKEMALWKDLLVPEEVLLALRDSKFTTPTHIQSLVLPHAIRDRLDIVGAAETGSGKTLAFGIPVIDKILKYKEQEIKKLGVENLADNEENSNQKGDSYHRDSDNSDHDHQSDDEEDSHHSYDGSHHIDNDDESELEWESDYSEQEMEGEGHSGDVGEISDGEQGLGCVTVIDDADFSSLGIEEIKVESISNQHPLTLILEPTRELAIQVKNHLLAVLKYTDIQVATIVGGMSLQKQQRILKKHPEIIVATPGRLWEIFQMGESYLLNLDKIQSLVIDEADRMVEKGHFEELEKLCQHINKDDKKKRKRQNFVFSATLTMIHVGPNRPTKKKKVKLTEAGKLEALIEKIGLRGKPKIIDLSRKEGTVDTLTEARVNCTKEEKDLYLYYFLSQFPGRTLVFANSKDCIRRLMSIFTLLQVTPLQLHADMHQRQRLKNLERFTANPNGLLFASDVAARGLDIPNVQHVIHYQVPLTVENYVHRSGRTARASKEGISVMFVGPDDVRNYRKIIYTLNRNEDLPIMPVDYQLLPVMKQRLSLAIKIDVTEHRFEKKKRQNDWFLKAAKDMDMELDDRHLLNDLGDSSEQCQHKQHIKHQKQELNNLLHQSLMPKTFSGKYPTKMGKLVAPTDSKKESDAITCVKKDRKAQEKLVHQIQRERTIKQKNLESKLKEKKSKRQKKRKNRKHNKES